MQCRSAGPVLSFFLVALCSPVMAQPGPAPGTGQTASCVTAARGHLELGYIVPAKEDPEGRSAGDGIQVLEDGSVFRDSDWQTRDADDRVQDFGLGSPQAGYRVAAEGTHAFYAANMEDLDAWAIRIARATPATRFMVLLDPERARVFAFHEGQGKFLPVLWVDRDGHWIVFHWQWVRDVGAGAPALLATEEAGRGVRFSGGAEQLEESLAPADPAYEPKDGQADWDGSDYWVEFYGKDPDGTGPGSGQADALQRRLAGIQQRSQGGAGGPAAFVPPEQEGAASAGAGAGVGADFRRFVGRAGDALLDGAAAVHVGIQRVPVLGTAYAGGARLGEAISGERVEFSSYAAGPAVRTLSLDERRQAAFEGTVATGALVAAGAVPGSTALTAARFTPGAGGAALQVAQVATACNASVVGAGAVAASAMVMQGGAGSGGGASSDAGGGPKTETPSSQHRIDPAKPAQDVLPGGLRREFPSQHLQKSLNEIKDLLRDATGEDKRSLQTAKKLLEQAPRLLQKTGGKKR